MSSFYCRESEPRKGDIATHPKHGEVTIIGQISVDGDFYYGYWLVEDENGEIRIVNIESLEDIGYYGD